MAEVTASLPVAAQWQNWLALRQLCRTNIINLCWELGYKDVDPAVHGEFAGLLERFSGGTDSPAVMAHARGEGKFTALDLICGYKPFTPNWYDLRGARRLGVLITRGGLKSTVVTIAHNIQWVLNYPDIRIRLHSATAKQVEGFYRELRNHFMYNERFRQLFPEFCPRSAKSGRVDDFGNMEGFESPARRLFRKEPTVSVSSAESVISSTHHEVLDVDDLVDNVNSETPGEVDRIKRNFSMLEPLVERGQTSKGVPSRGWMKLVGTIYSYSDLHYTTWQENQAKPPAKRSWHFHVRSAAPNYPDGPAWWPARLPLSELQKIENDPAAGPRVLYPQYLMQPKSDRQGLVENREDIRWMPRDKFEEYYAFIRPNVTIDLAGMETEQEGMDRDNTCINCHGFGPDGNLYVFELLYSRDVTPDDVISYLFWLWNKHPRIGAFKMEKENHARVLLPFLKKEMARRNLPLPMVDIQRDSRVSKVQRIMALQPWLKRRQVVHVDGLGFSHPRTGDYHEVRKQIEDEMLFFPRYNKRDYLDTLADAMQGRDGQVTADVIPQVRPLQDINPWQPAGTVNGETKWKHYGSFPVAMAEQLFRREMDMETDETSEVTD